MPKFIAHALVGASVVAAIHPTAGIKNWTPLFIGAVLAVSPDFDLALDKFFEMPSIHRGFSHSLLFSALVGLVIWCIIPKDDWRATIAFSFAYFSHLILDFFTSTSGGIKLFYPFSENYYNLGLTSLFELPIGDNFSQIFRWVAIELTCFLPIFITVLTLKELIPNLKK